MNLDNRAFLQHKQPVLSPTAPQVAWLKDGLSGGLPSLRSLPPVSSFPSFSEDLWAGLG